jgi:hypothetical protein
MRELHRPSTTQADKSLTPAPGITNKTLPARFAAWITNAVTYKGEPLMSLDAEAVAGRVRESSRLGRLEDLFSGWSPSGIAWPSQMLYRLSLRCTTGHHLP